MVSFWCLAFWKSSPSYEFMVYLLVTSRWSTPSAIRHPYSNMWINPVKIKAINLKMWLICKKLEVITIIKTVLISEASRVNFLCRTQSSLKVEFSLGPSTGVELKFVWGQASMESIWKQTKYSESYCLSLSSSITLLTLLRILLSLLLLYLTLHILLE